MLVSRRVNKHKFVPVRKSLKWQWLIWWTCPCHVFQMPPTATQMVAFCTLCEAGPAPALCRTLQGANMREGDSYHYIHATAYHVIFIFIIFQYDSSIHFLCQASAQSLRRVLSSSSLQVLKLISPSFLSRSWREILDAIDAKLKRIHMLEMIINISYNYSKFLLE